MLSVHAWLFQKFYGKELFGSILAFFFLFTSYFVTARLGLQMDAVSGFATLVWPPTGIAIACLLLFGERFWPAAFLAAALVNFLNGASVPVALAIGLGNALEAIIAVGLLRQLGFRLSFERAYDAIIFIVVAAGLSPMISATVGVTALSLAQFVLPSTYFFTWISWWLGDALGAIIVAPLLLTLSTRVRKEFVKGHREEAIALFLLLIAANIWIFFKDYSLNITTTSMAYLLVPMMVWAALRFGPAGTSVAAFIISVFAIIGTYLGNGPFAIDGLLSQSLIYLQLFIGFLTMTHLVLASVSTERSEAVGLVEHMNKHLEQRVREQAGTILEEKERDEAILKSIGDGVIVIDAKGHILFLNEAAERLLNITIADVVGKPYEQVLGMQDRSGHKVPLKKRPLHTTLTTGKPMVVPGTSTPYYVVAKRDPFPVAITTTPVFVSGKLIGAVQVFRDVSTEDKIEQAKSEFVALASHQLRTPLTGIRWQLDSLKSAHGNIQSKDAQVYIDAIEENIDRMNDLINVLLDVSKIDLGSFTMEPVQVNIKELVEEVLEEIHPTIKKKQVHVKQSYHAPAPIIHVDPNLLHIVLQNLISNGVKYSLPGGEVSIHVTQHKSELVIRVQDEGCGIPSEQMSKIFTKFFRATNARSMEPDGNGLGLYLSKSLVEQAGGTIRFDSKEGSGSTFFVTLPATSPDA